MDGESSNMHEITGKSLTSISENHGVKAKTSTKKPLLDNDQPAMLETSSHHESNDSIPMPDEEDAIISGFIPDINVYQNKKSAGTGMMDFALLLTNVNQLRHIISTFERNPFFYVSLPCVVISIILQIVVGIFLVLNSRYDVKDCEDICKANRINNWITILIFLITVVNVVLSAFEIPDQSI